MIQKIIYIEGYNIYVNIINVVLNFFLARGTQKKIKKKNRERRIHNTSASLSHFSPCTRESIFQWRVLHKKRMFYRRYFRHEYILIIGIDNFIGGNKDQWFHIDQAFGDSLVCFLAIQDYDSPYILPRRHNTEDYKKFRSNADWGNEKNQSLMDYLKQVLQVCIYMYKIVLVHANLHNLGYFEVWAKQIEGNCWGIFTSTYLTYRYVYAVLIHIYSNIF